MRFIAIILSLYVAVLAVYPCADGSEHHADHESIAATSQHEHTGNEPTHRHEGDDFCSPFCICHCCHTHVVFTLATPDFELPEPPRSFNSFYVNPIGTDHVYSFFRPPRV